MVLIRWSTFYIVFTLHVQTLSCTNTCKIHSSTSHTHHIHTELSIHEHILYFQKKKKRFSFAQAKYAFSPMQWKTMQITELRSHHTDYSENYIRFGKLEFCCAEFCGTFLIDFVIGFGGVFFMISFVVASQLVFDVNIIWFRNDFFFFLYISFFFYYFLCCVRQHRDSLYCILNMLNGFDLSISDAKQCNRF